MVIVEPLSSAQRDRPVAGGVGEAGDLGRALPDVERFDVLDDRHHQALLGLGGDAEVDGAVAVDDAVAAAEAGVQLREVVEGEHDGRARNGRTVSFGSFGWASLSCARTRSTSVTSTSSTYVKWGMR